MQSKKTYGANRRSFGRAAALVVWLAGGPMEMQAYKDTEALRTNTRTLFTIDALEAMARAVSGYPGRKNLMWLSGSFPFEWSLTPLLT